MPEAVTANRTPDPNLTRYYDEESGVCGPVSTPASGAAASASRSSAVPGEPGPHSPGVARLIADEARARDQPRSSLPVDDCVLVTAKATVGCAGAAVTIVAGTATGPLGILGAAIAGASCGVAAIDAYACLTKDP